MQPSDLVKQLTTYADGITAFCVLQALAFIYAVAGNEVFSKRVVRTDGAIACTIRHRNRHGRLLVSCRLVCGLNPGATSLALNSRRSRNGSYLLYRWRWPHVCCGVVVD